MSEPKVVESKVLDKKDYLMAEENKEAVRSEVHEVIELSAELKKQSLPLQQIFCEIMEVTDVFSKYGEKLEMLRASLRQKN